MQPTILFLAPLAAALNKVLALDPQSAQRLKRLQNKTIRITLLPVNIVLHCHFRATGIELTTEKTADADAHIIGTPLQLLGVIAHKTARHRFFADDVTITGDTELAQQVITLFDKLEIDWEEQLASCIGDIPAYHAGRVVNRIRHWFKETEQQCTQNMTDYLQEEKVWLPSKEALQDFFNDIDVLRMDADRLLARAKLLLAQQ